MRLACVEWSPAAIEYNASLGLAAGAAATLAPPSVKAKPAKDLFAGFSADVENPYAIVNKGDFVQYSWEAQEHRDMKKKIDALKRQYDVEMEQHGAIQVCMGTMPPLA